MKFVLVLALLSITMAVTALPPQFNPPSAGGAVALATPAPPPTLGKDLKRLKKAFPMQQLHQLIRRYLLNDQQFQTFVRIINSYDSFSLSMAFLTQPEVMTFRNWVRTQLMLSGGSFEMESDEFFTILNPVPYWSNSVSGWQGFMMELRTIMPAEYIQYFFQAQALQGGIFAQFWERIQGLQPAYDRVNASPAAARLNAQLEAAGITTADLDNYIRTAFGWNKPTPAPVSAEAGGLPGTGQAVVHPGPPAPAA